MRDHCACAAPAALTTGVRIPLPLIAVAIALIAASGGGVTAGAIGASDMAEAKKVAGRSRERYEAALAGHAKHEKNTGDHLASYGRRQIEVQTTTLAAWVSWLEANERKIKRLDRTVVDGLQVARPSRVKKPSPRPRSTRPT